MIIRGDGILAAAALLPLTEMSLSERFGTRHRAALGITEDTDAVAVVVSEENGQMSVVERARIVRVPTEAQLERALVALLESPSAPGRASAGARSRARGASGSGGRAGDARTRRPQPPRRPRPSPSPRRRTSTAPASPPPTTPTSTRRTDARPDAPPPGDDDAAATAGVMSDR